MPTPRRYHTQLFKIIIVTVTVTVVCGLLYRLFAQNDKSDARALNDSINERNKEYASHNEFGFTDINHSTLKPKGIFRIAVLGDSFIWGDGIHYEDIWSHKLESKLKAEYDSIEVLHWGHDGWSTLDEFNFVKEHGKDYNIDLLLIGWVDNDIDMGNIKQVYPTDIKQEYPILGKICPPIAYRLLDQKQIEVYANWVAQLYGEKNLKDYTTLLQQFHGFLQEHNIPSLYVITPSDFQEESERHGNTVKPLIATAGFACINLYQPLKTQLGKYPLDSLIASTVNGHPSKLLTEGYAKEVNAYLVSNNYIKAAHH